MPRPCVILLLGAPGVNKYLLGQLLSSSSASQSSFLSVGEELRKKGLLEEIQNRPTSDCRMRISQSARSILEEACRSLAGQGNNRVLVIECVNDVEDAFSLLELLDQYGLGLLQGLRCHVASKSKMKIRIRTALKAGFGP